jgi:ankyrin repeat protein
VVGEAVVYGQTAIAELLLQAKADMTVRNKNGLSLLGCAIINNCAETAEMLIQHGADITELDDVFITHSLSLSLSLSMDAWMHGCISGFS